MDEEGDTNETPRENKNQLKFIKTIMSVNNSSSEEPIPSDNQLSETGTDILTEDDFDGGLKIVIISDDEDAEFEHISDMSNPSYDPRRYISYKFRQSPSRIDNAPVFEETNRAARYPEIRPNQQLTCVDQSAIHDLNFATRYPNYMGDFKFIKYPLLEDVSPPEFQPNRPHYTIDIERDYNNFTPWRERAERQERLASSSKEVEATHLEDIDTDPQNLLDESFSEFQFSPEIRHYYQKPSTLISIENVSLEEMVANPRDKHEFVNLNTMQRTFKSVYQKTEPLPCYSTDPEAWELIRVSDTEQSTQDNPYSDLQQLVHPPPARKQKSTKDRSNSAPLIYEDCKENVYGPKPQYWIDFEEAGEIGKTVAIFDSRDFGYNNKNIKPRWRDENFDFHAPIRDDFHQFSKTFMTNIPFYDNESEDIKRFAKQYKLLRAGPKYNIQEPSEKKESTNIQNSQESKPSSDQLKSVLKPPGREYLEARDDECFEKRVYYRSDIAGSINPTSIKKVTFKLDNEESTNNPDVSQNAEYHLGVSKPITILRRKKETPEENADKSDVSKSTQSNTVVSIPTKSNEGAMTERNANSLDVTKNAQPHAGILTLTSKSHNDISVSKRKDAKSAVKTKKPEMYIKYSELNKQQFKRGFKQQIDNISENNDENLLVTKRNKKKNKKYLDKLRMSQLDQASPNTASGKTGTYSKIDDVKQGKTSESGNTKANKADKGNKSSKPKQGNQKYQKSRH